MITEAFAAAATTPAQVGNDMFGTILMLVGFGVILYFFLWRPQSKRVKEHRDLITNLAKGDEVITNGGIVGKLSKLTDDFVSIAISEGIEIKVQRSAITTVLPKGTMKSI